MDPFSAEGELLNIHSAFHQGQFQKVVDFDTSSLSASNSLPARILQLRARIALGEASAVQSELKSDPDTSSTPDLQAVQAFAAFSADGDSAKSLETATQLATNHSDNLTVQLLAGTILARHAGHEHEALTLLSKHQGSLDAVALTTHIHLALNRADLALQEVSRARAWGQDSLLVNLAEAWTGLRLGGQEKYQQAFYVYEELATNELTRSVRTLGSQGVCETHLARAAEAEAALGQAVAAVDAAAAAAAGTGTGAAGATDDEAAVLANKFVLDTILGKDKDCAEGLEKLRAVDAAHVLLLDLAAKQDAFQAARAKYSPKFGADDET